MYKILCTIPSSVVPSVGDVDGLSGIAIGWPRGSDGSAAVSASEDSESESESMLSDSDTSFECANRIRGNEALLD